MERTVGRDSLVAPDEHFLASDDKRVIYCHQEEAPELYSLDCCAHCDRGIDIMLAAGDDVPFLALLCQRCEMKAVHDGLCPHCWRVPTSTLTKGDVKKTS